MTARGDERLLAAFEVFGEVARELEDAYGRLKSRVAALEGELAAARRERSRQEREKARLATRLAQVLEALPAGVVVVDDAGVAVAANAEARRLLGEPVVQLRWDEIAAREYTGEPRGTGCVDLKGGFRVTVASRPLAVDRGRILLFNDVTEAETLRELLARQERLAAMGAMAATLAHQIRTPLAAALLYASQLTAAALSDGKRQQFADRVLDRLQHLERLIDDMLRFTRGGGQGASELSVRSLLEDLEAALAPQLPDAARLTVRCAVAELAISGNHDALLGALLNLAINAIQAGGPGVELEVTARSGPPGWIELVVADDGPGIAAEIEDRIFEPFFTTRSDGTGLGLAVVRAVAEAHGGATLLERAPGGGAVFGLRLPLGKAPQLLPGTESGWRHAGRETAKPAAAASGS